MSMRKLSPTSIGSEESLLNDDDKTRLPRLRRIASDRHVLILTCAILAAASLFGLLIFSVWTTSHSRFYSEQDLLTANLNASASVHLDPHVDPMSFINGPPTLRFRENLRNDTKYMTSWLSAGWTNDVMTYGNLIYLALITDRVPIIAMFTPSHVGGGNAPTVAFGDVFDVPRLSKTLGKPVLEWRQVKDPNSTEIDELGCWAIWPAVQYREHHPRISSVPSRLSLDISYTFAPSWTKLIPDFEHDPHSTFWSLASLAYPELRASNLVTPLPSPLHQVSLPPDEQVVCYDYLYYVCAHQPFEYERDYSPAWRYVVQHMRWTTSLEDIAEGYVRRTLGVADGEPIPPWITIHARHKDFSEWCKAIGSTLDECFPSIPVLARRVDEVKQELLERKGIVANHVIVTSDEENATWWGEITAHGWLSVDHSQTKELYNAWYPVLIDAVIQSNGWGFVGTARSTMSLLARRRVESWRDGVGRTVGWGKPDSDDH